MALRTLSTFTGGCGLELGLELAFPGALEPIMYVESEITVAGLLAALMETGLLAKAPVWSDIRTVTHAEPRACIRARGGVQVVTGGYPCMDFSTAGKRRGFQGEKGKLWFSLKKAIRCYRPKICFLENVGGHLRRGFDRVRTDLRRMGYSVKAGLFTAKEVGDSQNRERLFILGYLRQCSGSVANEQQREVQRTLLGSAVMQLAVEPKRWNEGLACGKSDDGEVLLLKGSARQTGLEPGGRGSRLAGSKRNGRRQGAEDVCTREPESSGASQGLAVERGRNPLDRAKGVRRGGRRGDEGRARREGGGRSEAEASGRAVASAKRDDLRDEPGRCGGPDRQSEALPVYALPVFPPGPGLTHARVKGIRKLFRKDPARAREVFEAEFAETVRWAEVLAVAPQFAPAIAKEAELAFCELAHGLARVDVLRILGNGVVPLEAAYGFSTLVAAAGWTV